MESIRAFNYNGAMGALNNINALFPEEYRVRVVTPVQYEQAILDKVYYVCSYCNEEISSANIELKEQRNSLIVEVLTKSRTTEAWKCPKCSKHVAMSATKIIRERAEEPYYLKVIPPCPVKNSGLQNRLGFHQKFSKWFYKYLEELEYQLGLYRIEYAAQAEADDMVEYAPDEE